tara:strand:- start:3562 stop:4431 length:870 start_codon:yes stop_codon:yes gene_type:complete
MPLSDLGNALFRGGAVLGGKPDPAIEQRKRGLQEAQVRLGLFKTSMDLFKDNPAAFRSLSVPQREQFFKRAASVVKDIIPGLDTDAFAKAYANAPEALEAAITDIPVFGADGKQLSMKQKVRISTSFPDEFTRMVASGQKRLTAEAKLEREGEIEQQTMDAAFALNNRTDISDRDKAFGLVELLGADKARAVGAKRGLFKQPAVQRYIDSLLDEISDRREQRAANDRRRASGQKEIPIQKGRKFKVTRGLSLSELDSLLFNARKSKFAILEELADTINRKDIKVETVPE